MPNGASMGTQAKACAGHSDLSFGLSAMRSRHRSSIVHGAGDKSRRIGLAYLIFLDPLQQRP